MAPPNGTKCPEVYSASEIEYPCSVERQENLGPYSTRSPLGHLGLSRDDHALSSFKGTVTYFECVFICFLLRQLYYFQLIFVEYVG